MTAQRTHREFLEDIADYEAVHSFLEVGVREGDSALAVLRGSRSVDDLALCDTWGFQHGGTGRGSHAHVESAIIATGYEGNIEWLDGPSAYLIPKLSRQFDLVHVDGDHSESAALTDLRNCWLKTRIVLVVHDIFMAPVWTAVSTWLHESRTAIDRTSMSVQDFGTLAVWRKS